MKKTGIKDYIFLHFVLLIYSVTSVFSKMASQQEGVSFLLFYGGVLLCLALYAVLWQAVLKKFDLTVAFANKAAVVIWGILWGALVFHEAVTPSKVIGAAVIMAGIVIVAKEDEEK